MNTLNIVYITTLDPFIVLKDETLENENIKNGDNLIIEEGRLPPKVNKD